MKKTKKVKIIIFFVLVILYVVAGILEYYRGENKRIIYKHRELHHPIINALIEQNIKLGESVDILLSSWPPSRYSIHDNYTTLFYFKDNKEIASCCASPFYIQIIARDKKLSKAIAVEGALSEIENIFFSDMYQAEEDYYWDSYDSRKK